MIHVERSQPAPEILLTKGVEEQDEAEKTILAHLAAVAKAISDGKEPPKKPSIDFKRYKDDDVKEILIELFHGKCAYCESFYSSTQPMDVEHFRPKGAVELDEAEAGDDVHLGYYWLAATWDNLLPSCIDCNRKRGQFDVVAETTMQLGKKDRFPIAGSRARERAAVLDDEQAKLVNPCLDDPDELFRFDTEFGVVVPRLQSGPRRARAEASIEVYGLNRSGLVTDRLHVLRMIDHHLEVVRLLTDVRDQLDTPDLAHLVDVVDDVINIELQAIFDMRQPSRPYAGMARQVIAELAPDLS